MGKRQTFVLNGCQSELPKPEQPVCPIDSCGVAIQESHWCCRDHFVRFPRRFRLFANQFRGFWAGDPHYDRFIELANAINDRVDNENAVMLDDLIASVAELEKDEWKPGST